MKKYIILFLLTLIVMPLQVKAFDYNGSDKWNNFVGNGSSCDREWDSFCPNSSLKNTTIKVTIAHVSNGTIKRYASHYYMSAGSTGNAAGQEIYNNAVASAEFTVNGAGTYFGTYSSIENAISKGSYAWYNFSSSAINSYFTENTNFFGFFENYFKSSRVSNLETLQTWMRQECEALGFGQDYNRCHGPKGSPNGFRILIEPVYTGIITVKENAAPTEDEKQIVLWTTKEIAANTGWTNPTRGMAWAVNLYLDETDVGISAISRSDASKYSQCAGTSCNATYNSLRSTIASDNSGFGLNIISWPIESITGSCGCTYDKNNNPVCSPKGCNCDLSRCPVKKCECTYDDEDRPICKDGCNCDLSLCPAGVCNYKLNVSIPTMCDAGYGSGYIKDIKNWKCIFDSENNAKSEIKTHYYESGNKYCKAYCREEVTAKFPSTVSVNQGRYMVVNNDLIDANINPLRYTGQRTCRVTSSKEGRLDKETFTSDLAAANVEVKKAWDAYQTAKAVYKAYTLSTSSTETDNDSCTVKWVQNQATINDYEKYNDELSDEITNLQKQINSASASMASTLSSCLANANKKKVSQRDDAIKACNDAASSSQQAISDMEKTLVAKQGSYRNIDSIPYDVCPGSKQSKTRWTSTSASYGVYSGSQGGGYDYAQYYYQGTNGANTRATFSAAKATAENNVTKTYEEYTRQKNARDNIITKFENCTTALPNNVLEAYKFEPKVSIKYEERVYGGKWIDLKSTLKEDKKVTYYQDNLSTTQDKVASSSIKEEVAATTSCVEQSKCTNTTQKYSYSKWWESEITKEYTYKLPSNTYRYVDKASGQSKDSPSKNGLSYDIGFGNLPVHFSTMPGSYEYEVKTTDFGEGNKFYKFIFQDNKFNNKSYYKGNPLMYGCNYNVNCSGIILNNNCVAYNGACGSKGDSITCRGLNVVYRTISLKSQTDAFPGASGFGRKPGANWAADQNVSNYILNNRGATSYDVYKLKPMYEMELTPALMKLFRNYNKQMNKTYTSMYSETSLEKVGIVGYSDYLSMTCSGGKTCRSSLLRGKMSGYEDIKVVGCAMKGTGYNTNCGTKNEAW